MFLVILKENMGKHFDPDLGPLFISVVERKISEFKVILNSDYAQFVLLKEHKPLSKSYLGSPIRNRI